MNTSTHATWGQLAWFGFYSENAIYEGAWWSLITSAFVHIQPMHFFFNMYWLFLLGPVLEREFGSLRLLVFILASAFVSSGCEFILGHSGIGFSGVGYAMVGFGAVARLHR